MRKQTRKPTRCVQCGFPIASSVRYCPDCGWDQRQAVAARPSTFRKFAIAALLGMSLWFVLWQGYGMYLAEREELSRRGGGMPAGGGNALQEIPMAAVSRGLVQANSLLARLREHPDDSQALGQMASLSFDREVFRQAVDLYRRYLVLKPEDMRARLKYAGALQSIGSADEAIVQYQQVLTKDPASFDAYANLALLYSKSGRKSEALASAEAASKNARAPEDRARIEELAAQIRGGQVPQTSGLITSRENRGPASEDVSVYDRVVNLVWDNSAVGSKLTKSGLRAQSGTLALYFRGLDMAQLDAGAKEELFSGIQSLARSEGRKDLKAVAFVDADTDREMGRVRVNGE